MKNTQAFTLIELLVVVLIIGILAAVAVPQYQVAVGKARFATYRTLADSIAKAVLAHHFATGEWTKDIDVLDVAFPAGMTQGECLHGTAVYTNDTYCCLTIPVPGQTYGEVLCGDKKNYTFAYENTFAFAEGTPTALFRCVVKPARREVCKSLGGQLTNTNRNLLQVGSSAYTGGYYSYILPGSITE